MSRLAAIGSVVILAAVWAGWLLFRTHANSQQSTSVTGQTASQQAAVAPAIASQNSTAQRPGPASTVPSVIHVQLPNVPRKALATIHGHFRIGAGGRRSLGHGHPGVAENTGPSLYFARLALDAAMKSKFAPADPPRNTASGCCVSELRAAASPVTPPRDPSLMSIWRPGREQVVAHHALHARSASRHGIAVADYSALHAWSVAEPAAFWSEPAVSRTFGPTGAWGLHRCGADARCALLPEASLNFAENLLRIGIINLRSSSAMRRRSLLSEHCMRPWRGWPHGLESQGVGPGDRIVAVLPNIPEARIGMLATEARGAIWSSSSSDLHGRPAGAFRTDRPEGAVLRRRLQLRGQAVRDCRRSSSLSARLPSIERVALVKATCSHSRRSPGSNTPSASRNLGGTPGTST